MKMSLSTLTSTARALCHLRTLHRPSLTIHQLPITTPPSSLNQVRSYTTKSTQPQTTDGDEIQITDNANTISLVGMSDAEKIRILQEERKSPASGRSLTDIASDIWQHNKTPTGAGHRSGLKILSRPLKGPLYKSWYPLALHEIEGNKFILTDKQERWKKKLKMLRASGKGPPKKGSGKRSK